MKNNALTAIMGVSVITSHYVVAAPNTEMATTLVTATRTEQTVNASLAPVTVFSRDDIERVQAKTLTELLKRVPGIEFSTSGGRGAASSLYIRGADDSHTLFLVDGQRVNSATLGSSNFQFIDPEQIERIEVVRGPRSSIYGSDAIGGVIQIFTKKGDKDPAHYLRAGAGSHNAYQVAAGSRGSLQGIRYAANVSYFDTEGFDYLADDTPPNDDDDAHRNRSASLNVGYDFQAGGRIDLNYFYTKARTHTDDPWAPIGKPYSDNWIQTTNLTVVSPTIGPWTTKVLFGNAVDDSDELDDLDPSAHDKYRTTRDSFTWKNDVELGANQLLTVGYDYYEDEIDTSGTYTDGDGEPVDTRDNSAVFGVYQAEAGQFSLQLGLREDDNESFGTEITANAAIGYDLDGRHRIIASYGEGYKAPTFNDLYYPGAGNPDLQPEQSENYELEFRGRYQAFNWQLNVYQTDIDNLIAWAPESPGSFTYVPSNINEAEIEGAELALSAMVLEWSVTAGINVMQAEDEATDNQLVNRPEKSLSIDADRTFERWQVGFTLRATDHRYGDEYNTERVPGYGVVDVRAGYQFTERLEAQLKLNNIFDNEYSTRYNYNADGFNTFMTLTYTL